MTRRSPPSAIWEVHITYICVLSATSAGTVELHNAADYCDHYLRLHNPRNVENKVLLTRMLTWTL